ncbi:MAG: Asp-tRNA(Asn)/Glu-tRNA(Gln) amidotransferase subunit GatA [Clostridiaceae bacterium]|jgi:aspartyl-tRNA(Asn)/glutamyl-tRNA(Gln) amidotransferase subunit A|nr:Asp-tRNA(Asn)/Glu-tRNA(Gln) amidotransferase subunit GatA [Clostridiaceae bacterium]
MIKELRKKLDARKISAEELTAEYLKRIAGLDKSLNSYVSVNPNAALAAKESQKRIDAGKAGMLTGIPVALKDILCTYDMPTTCSSKMLEGYTPPYDATVVKRLREDGAVFLGKLNMDEFAMGASTKTSYFGKTYNPYGKGCVPGGSSGGSGAAVAAELCAASLGSDTGGSIRQPAAFCGVTGHRPTYGLVSRFGGVAFASSLDQIGPLAESAEDCALVLQTIAGGDINDQTCAGKSFSAADVDEKRVKGMKIGVITELMGADVDEEVAAAVELAVKKFEALGAKVRRVSLPMLKHAVPVYYLISSAEASSNLSRFDGVRYGHRSANEGVFEEMISQNRAEGFGWEVKRRIMLGSYALCSGYYDDYYKRAVKLCGVIRAQYAEAFKDNDLLVSPTAPTTAYPYDEVPSNPAQMYLADICTVSAALAGLPSVSTPCGYSAAGMPIGLMLTGRRFDDAGVLSAAAAYERDFKCIPPALLNGGGL